MERRAEFNKQTQYFDCTAHTRSLLHTARQIKSCVEDNADNNLFVAFEMYLLRVFTVCHGICNALSIFINL